MLSVVPVGDVVYDGFISYSHAADDLLAPRLQAGLQRFAKPWWKRRALRMFRDESSLSANPHLWSSITDYVGWDHQCVGIGRYSIRKWLHFVDHRGRKAPRLPVLVRPKDEEAAFAELRRCGWQLKR
jgi:hypothetical protein